jgi:hypothetical protein
MRGHSISSPGTISDEGQTSIAPQTFTVDWTVDQYIIRTIALTDITTILTVEDHKIQLIRF